MPKDLRDTFNDIYRGLGEAQPIVKYGKILADIGQKAIDKADKFKIPNPPVRRGDINLPNKRGRVDPRLKRRKK